MRTAVFIESGMRKHRTRTVTRKGMGEVFGEENGGHPRVNAHGAEAYEA